jgi:UDP-N-acetyl-2-amino-2-deoxyglucuronate dehydrogenase
LNIGIVGCGFIGQKHIRSMANVQELQLYSVCDTVMANLETGISLWKKLRGEQVEPKQFFSFEKMLQEESLDAVLLCIPSGYHAQMAISALQRGKHVIVEKPMALSTTDARDMQQVANENGLTLMVCHQKRFVPHLSGIRNLIQSGKLGRIVYSDMRLLYNRKNEYYTSSPWRGTWDKDGGVLMNQAIHDLDLLCWIVGKPVSVTAQVNRLIRPMEAEDSVVATFQMMDGSLSSFVATVCVHTEDSDESMTIVGTDGAFVLSGKLFEQVKYWHVSGEQPPVFVQADLYSELYRNFIESIARGSAPLVSGADGYETIQTAMAVYEAALSGQRVMLPVLDFSTSMMQGMFSSVSGVSGLSGGDETSV